jgi:hypothetical protein
MHEAAGVVYPLLAATVTSVVMAFHWRLVPADLVPDDAPLPSSFPSQSDAESWLGENWRALADAGIETAALVDGQDAVYDMSLAQE